MQQEKDQESQSLGGLERMSLLKGGLQGVRLPARWLETPVPAVCGEHRETTGLWQMKWVVWIWPQLGGVGGEKTN